MVEQEVSAPTRGPWIEIIVMRFCPVILLSAPTRGPWIEMLSVR